MWRAGHFRATWGEASGAKRKLPRRILADFFIAAHAALDRYSLMTLDQRLYRAACPKLEILTF